VAVHVAAASDLGDDLEGMVTCDERPAEAPQLKGIKVFALGEARRASSPRESS